jgi:hypothetical protein
MTKQPWPVRVVKRRVVQESAYAGAAYRRRIIGHSVAVILSDGSEVTCDHAHRGDEAARKCAQAIVNRINAAARTVSP